MESEAFVQPEGLRLINSGFQPQELYSLLTSVYSQMFQHMPSQSCPPEMRTHEHPFDFAVCGANQLDAAATRW